MKSGELILKVHEGFLEKDTLSRSPDITIQPANKNKKHPTKNSQKSFTLENWRKLTATPISVGLKTTPLKKRKKPPLR